MKILSALAALVLAFAAALTMPIAAGVALAVDAGVTLERGDNLDNETDRSRLAKGIYSHNFENVRDPDTGRSLPESASLNPEGWPDFWEPIRAVGFPEYLIPTVRVVPDGSNTIPGAYRDAYNHALTMEFDGTRVGIRTKAPVPIDPLHAYEYSILLKDSGLHGARIRTGIDWMRIDPAATTVLRSDETPGLTPGQLDWPVVPFTMLVNDPPPKANAARMFIIIDRDPDQIGGAYHGTLYVDNISLKPLPKITIDPPRAAANGTDRVIPVRYLGLFENIPDPDNPGYFKGSRYSRRVGITDVYGEPVDVRLPSGGDINPDDSGTAIEEIPFPRDKYGVYYFNIRLYDGGGSLLTDVIRSVAVMRPGAGREGPILHSSKPVFGVDSESVPSRILGRRGLLKTIIERLGVKMTKISPWLDSPASTVENEAYYNALVDEIHNLNTGGVHVTGVINPPARTFDGANLATAIELYADRLNAVLTDAGRRLGLFVDNWQMGKDDDPSFASIPPGANLDAFLDTLKNFAGGMPVVATIPLSAHAPSAFPVRPSVIQAAMSEMTPARVLWPLTALVFPWLFEPYYNQRGEIYPPPALSALAPRPAMDKLEEETRKGMRSGSWIALEIPPANPQEPNAATERVQLEEMMVKGIYSSIVSPDAIFLGSLFDPARGMLRRDVAGSHTLETMARPTYLGAYTLNEFMESSQYLGQLWLLPPFEAHAFRKPGSESGIIAIWHNDVRGTKTLSRAEIAAGPSLEQVDWAGNRTPVGQTIQVRKVPSFLVGMPAGLLLTRMSMRINPEPQMLAMNRRQGQTLEIVNHMSRQAPILVRLRYAARMPDGTMENNWMLQPKEMRLNLRPYSSEGGMTGSVRFDVTPDSNSQIQLAAPGETDKTGLKIARAAVTFNTSPPADMTLYLPFNLRSDIDVDIEALPRENDPHFITLQLKMRWFPSEDDRRRGDVRLTPYYVKRGQMKEAAAFPVAVKAQDSSLRGDPEAPFDAIELRIPRRPRTQTWVGLDEVGGSRFYIADVTQYLDHLVAGSEDIEK